MVRSRIFRPLDCVLLTKFHIPKQSPERKRRAGLRSASEANRGEQENRLETPISENHPASRRRGRGAPHRPERSAWAGRRDAPSDRISVAGLGIGGRGARDLESFLSQKDVQFRAICDVRNERREAIKSRADKHHGNNDCVMYSDMNDLWARDDIDAVLIATGDRRHTLLSIMTASPAKTSIAKSPAR